MAVEKKVGSDAVFIHQSMSGVSLPLQGYVPAREMTHGLMD